MVLSKRLDNVMRGRVNTYPQESTPVNTRLDEGVMTIETDKGKKLLILLETFWCWLVANARLRKDSRCGGLTLDLATTFAASPAEPIWSLVGD
jgi:hypothetical protein